MMQHYVRLALGIGLLVLPVQAHAQSAPALINYQGQLQDAKGAPLPTGDYVLTFSVWDAANGGNRVWGPQIFDGQTAPGHGLKIPVVQGFFNVMLGPVDTGGNSLATAFEQTTRHIEIGVGNNPPISPRQQILSAPYAFKSLSADTARAATNAATADNATKLTGFDWSALFGVNNPGSGTILDSKIRDGSINASKLQPTTITSNQIAGGTINTFNIADGAITAQKIASGAVGSAQITNGAITSSQIALGAINTGNIANGSITSEKLASDIFTFTRYFQSAEVAITADAVATAAHGLGGVPVLFTCVIRCKTAELGYAVGDEVICSVASNGSGGESLSAYCDATNCGFSGDLNLGVIDRSNHTGTNITLANWRIIFRAWR